MDDLALTTAWALTALGGALVAWVAVRVRRGLRMCPWWPRHDSATRPRPAPPAPPPRVARAPVASLEERLRRCAEAEGYEVRDLEVHPAEAVTLTLVKKEDSA